LEREVTLGNETGTPLAGCADHFCLFPYTQHP
jgi:hypothetical protein